MGKIITLSHQKGGVGKSTLTFNLAERFKDHLKTAVVDLDPQGTLSQLSKLANDFDIIAHTESLQKLRQLPYEVIFVDTPPYLSHHLPELFSLSDLIVVPTKAGIADLMAIRSTVRIIEEVQKSEKALLVLNMIKSSTSLTEDIKKMLLEFSIPIAQTQIADRVSYARSLLSKGVSEDKKAQTEMESLSEELIKQLMN